MEILSYERYRSAIIKLLEVHNEHIDIEPKYRRELVYSILILLDQCALIDSNSVSNAQDIKLLVNRCDNDWFYCITNDDSDEIQYDRILDMQYKRTDILVIFSALLAVMKEVNKQDKIFIDSLINDLDKSFKKIFNIKHSKFLKLMQNYDIAIIEEL